MMCEKAYVCILQPKNNSQVDKSCKERTSAERRVLKEEPGQDGDSVANATRKEVVSRATSK